MLHPRLGDRGQEEQMKTFTHEQYIQAVREIACRV
jgi:hypothetical protein